MAYELSHTIDANMLLVETPAFRDPFGGGLTPNTAQPRWIRSS